jgi:nitrite reductase/ring-hydroxylating ferredoxin subunit
VTLLDGLETLDVQQDSDWTTACAYERLVPGRGVGVLMPGGTQVALFRLDDGSCLDDQEVSVPVFRTRINEDGDVQVCP